MENMIFINFDQISFILCKRHNETELPILLQFEQILNTKEFREHLKLRIKQIKFVRRDLLYHTTYIELIKTICETFPQ